MSLGFKLKRNDAEAIEAYLEDESGAVNLTGATVTLKLKGKAAGSTVTSISCTVADAALGKVTATIPTSATAATGAFRMEFEVVFSSGATPKTFPKDSWIPVTIIEDLG